MYRPTFLVYLGVMLLGAALGAAAGDLFGLIGGVCLPVFVTAMLPVTGYLTVGAWDLPKNHPLSLLLGLILFLLFAATIMAWISLSSQYQPLPPGPFGALVGAVGCLVSAPGILRLCYRSRIRAGAPPAVIATALVDEDNALRCRAAEILGDMGMPAAAPAVPLLLWAAREGDAIVRVKAEQALKALGLQEGRPYS